MYISSGKSKIILFCYRPQTKFAKVMFLHVSVCPQGEYLGRCPPGRYPRAGTPAPWPGTSTPPSRQWESALISVSMHYEDLHTNLYDPIFFVSVSVLVLGSLNTPLLNFLNFGGFLMKVKLRLCNHELPFDFVILLVIAIVII